MQLIITNKIDELLFKLVSGFFINLFLVWIVANFIKSNSNLVWFITIPMSALVSIFLTKGYKLPEQKTSFLAIKSLGIFITLLTVVALFFLEPLIRWPFSTTGVPYKDMHDSIAYFISEYGYPPSSNLNNQEGKFIRDSYHIYYLGYPNLFHSFSAQLIKLGIFDLHATYIAAVIGLVICSISLYLILNYLYKDSILNAMISGLFGLSSLRIIFGTVISIPMFFSYTLVIPALLIFFVSTFLSKNKLGYVLPIITLSVLGASYYSVFFIFLILLFILFMLFYFIKDDQNSNQLIKLIIYSLPLLIFILFQQHEIYKKVLFFSNADYDPDDFSHHFFPYEKPFYMAVYFFSLTTIFSSILKKGTVFVRQHLLKKFFFVFNLILLIPILFDLIFRSIYKIYYYKDISAADPNGLFGGVNHQLMSRFSLLQPFFFIFILAEFVHRTKNKFLSLGIFVLIVLTAVIIRTDGVFDYPIMLETKNHFYNDEDQNKLYNLASYFYLFFNKEIWTIDYKNALLFLKKNLKQKDLVFLKDEYYWNEEAMARWGSLYIKHRIYKGNQVKQEFRVEEKKVVDKVLTDFDYFLVHRFVQSSSIMASKHWTVAYKNHNMTIYRKNLKSL